jgi:hypothetical protein
MAAPVSPTKTTVPREACVATTEAAAVASAETSMAAPTVTAATLRPQRNSQEKRERRDVNQAAHTGLL